MRLTQYLKALLDLEVTSLGKVRVRKLVAKVVRLNYILIGVLNHLKKEPFLNGIMFFKEPRNNR